ncbi:MAG: ATP-binding protein [Alphaproteobacteria bacterium]|nr:ATP-binding protein [Alphaproteobacteria bacterium]
MSLSPGINVFIGENGTGKTHILKVLYAAAGSHVLMDFPIGLANVIGVGFVSYDRLRSIERPETECTVGVTVRGRLIEFNLTDGSGGADSIPYIHNISQENYPINLPSTYIPPKEVLENAPGFRSLYNLRHISFGRVYAEILDKAFLPSLRKLDGVRQALVDGLEPAIGGKVVIVDELFFIETAHGRIPFGMVAEGIRKIALLSVLICNGCLEPGSVLFWDEPDANLNPKLLNLVVKTLLTLQRSGVQIFLATHNYFVLKELDLQRKKQDRIAFYSLYRDEKTNAIAVAKSRDFLGITHDAISDAFDDIYDRDIEKALGEPPVDD